MRLPGSDLKRLAAVTLAQRTPYFHYSIPEIRGQSAFAACRHAKSRRHCSRRRNWQSCFWRLCDQHLKTAAASAVPTARSAVVLNLTEQGTLEPVRSNGTRLALVLIAARSWSGLDIERQRVDRCGRSSVWMLAMLGVPLSEGSKSATYLWSIDCENGRPRREAAAVG
jgi:hypothetical protein